MGVEKAIKGIQDTLLKELKNSDCDKSALQYELNRMQQLDRLKVAHAKDSFYNPDAGTLLPSLDTAVASCSQGGLSSTPQPRLLPDRSLDHPSLMSERQVVTQNELHGLCERFNKQPSHRQRIIIARSCDPRHADGIHELGQGSYDFAMKTTELERRPQIGSLDK